MLDHVFTDAISTVRHALEDALLERHQVEESLTVDVLLGDVEWETAYSLPGEEVVPRVVADIRLLWSTWSQAAYRSWSTGLGDDEPPMVDVEVVLRFNRLAQRPDPKELTDATPDVGPTLGVEPLRRSMPTLTEQTTVDGSHFTAELEYTGSILLTDETLENGDKLATLFAPLGPWLASTLVRMADLGFEYVATEEDETS